MNSLSPLKWSSVAFAVLWTGWMIWWTRLLLYHVPVRLGIMVADLPVHGSHHLWPRDKHWANAIHAYREVLGCLGPLAPVDAAAERLKKLKNEHPQ